MDQIYWETANNWFSSLPCAGGRHLVWHASCVSRKMHWDPFSCESEQREALGELCALRLVTELAPHTAAGKS